MQKNIYLHQNIMPLSLKIGLKMCQEAFSFWAGKSIFLMFYVYSVYFFFSEISILSCLFFSLSD